MSNNVMIPEETNGELSPKASPLKPGSPPMIGKNNNNNNMPEVQVDHQNNIRPVKRTSCDHIDADPTVLQRFYSGANVFVTGATGFMGKVLIEKLLRSCPDIENIYIIVREKKGRSVEERIDDLIGSPCFNRIKKECPKFRTKLHAVAGDIGLVGLGISETDRQLLEQKVDIVFHVAATVRFDEKLKTAILLNVRGTREVLRLSKTFKRLRAVLHVSTAYSSLPSVDVAECLLESPIDCRKAIEMAETLDMDIMEQVAPTVIGQWPNTYAFTKAVSEDAVNTYGQGLPVGIFRPAIVVSTISEPMPGWIDNMYGPTGAMVGVSAGFLRTMNLKKENDANVVPCDMVMNAMIASAWDVATNRPTEMPVYNFVSPKENPLTWDQFTATYIHYGKEYPTIKCIWYYSLTPCSSRYGYLLLRFLLHTLPAIFMDLFLLATNKKPQMFRTYNKIHKFLDVIAYFGTNLWKFRDANVVDLWDKLDSRDQEIFFFNMRDLHWDTYIRNTCPGLREYILGDTMDNVVAARKRFNRLYVLHRLTQCLFVCLLLWLTLMVLSSVLSSSNSSVTSTHVNMAAQADPVAVTY